MFDEALVSACPAVHLLPENLHVLTEMANRCSCSSFQDVA
jgi:hypothetical protein